LPEGFAMDAEESKLAELHKLDVGQIAWRRGKISQLGSSEYFAQEYPLDASEAFISSTAPAMAEMAVSAAVAAADTRTTFTSLAGTAALAVVVEAQATLTPG
jgi:hypothetical protein